MGKVTIGKNDLETWCKNHNRQDLLEEWDYEKNKSSPLSERYDSSSKFYWKCQNGHSYYRPILTRTRYGLGCSRCDPKNKLLPIGAKSGCLTIIGYSKGKESYRGDYVCQCKCGKEYIYDERLFLERRRYCTKKIKDSQIWWGSDPALLESECGLIRAQENKLLASYRRIKEKSYDIDFTGTIHESLEVLECIDDNYEVLSSYSDKRKKGGGTYTVCKLYKCRCYLCGKEHKFTSSNFTVHRPPQYGPLAYGGYDSYAHCDCHEISSFQWRTIYYLKEQGIAYLVEVAFRGLYGNSSIHPLRFDFAIFDKEGKIKCLIECQGKQHYEPSEDFGGSKQYEIQKAHDEKKRQYAKKLNIPLIEIPYTCNTYEKEAKFLREHGIK